jgi:hypothetical protein
MFVKFLKRIFYPDNDLLLLKSSNLISFMEKALTKIAELIFDIQESILYIKVIEGAEMNFENTRQHYDIIRSLTGNKAYGALIDATEYYSIDAETLRYTSLPETIDNRIASAHCNPHNANSLTANFFKTNHQPPIPFQIFKVKEEALHWLRIQIRNAFLKNDTLNIKV